MKRWLHRDKFSRQANIVLVLQDESAYWLKIERDQIVDSFIESIDDGAERAVDSPAWISGVRDAHPLKVKLVLDTTLDEVDRVTVDASGNRVIDAYRRHTTLGRLRADYPHASVYSLPENYGEAVAALMHPALPAVWESWLLQVQSSGVVFDQVCTGTELVAHWSRAFTGRVLLVMQAGNYQRHLMLHGGAVIFLRTVKNENVLSVADAGNVDISYATIAQTMDYLDSTLELCGDETLLVRVLERGVVTSEKLTAPGIASTTCADQQRLLAATCTQSSAHTLASMLIANAVHYNCHIWRKGQSHLMTDKHRRLLPVDSEKYVNTASTAAQSEMRLRPGSIRQWLRKCGWHQRHTDKKWSVSNQTTRWIETLALSANYQKSVRQIAIVFKASITLAIMSALALGIVVVNSVSSVRAMDRQRIQIDANTALAAEAQAVAAQIVNAPLASAQSLFLVDRLENDEVFQPDIVVSDIASAVTATPGVQLDQMLWAYAAANAGYDSLSYALDSVGHRQPVDAVTQGQALQLEVSGRLSGVSLIDGKRQLDEFILELSKLPRIKSIHVLESPADAALSSEVNDVDRQVFRLSLVMGTV